MILVGIDIGKNKHTFSMVDKETGEILSNPYRKSFVSMKSISVNS